MYDVRQEQLSIWINEIFDEEGVNLQPLSGDAGFRRYFRFEIENQSYIAVDSPKDKCNNLAFCKIQHLLLDANVNVPLIHFVDNEQGFFCLSDLGEVELSKTLNSKTVISHYKSAIDILPNIASAKTQSLPVYDQEFVQTELNIFIEWLLEVHLSIRLSAEEKQQLQLCFDCLIENAVEQPQVVMHRDFHSRNLMWSEGNLAVIDFQDAVIGPASYDLVSLLRDCYVKWPDEVVDELLNYYIENYASFIISKSIPRAQWNRWFDLMGVQRHVKAAGIFSRLNYRDNKPNYMQDIPLTLSYIVDIASKYPELQYLHALVVNKVLPQIEVA